MVWHMQTGDRVLEGFEAQFYLEILQDSFLSTLEFTNWQYDDPKDFQLFADTGNGFFCRASFNQQIYLINLCLKALLKPDIPIPPLDHLLEAAAFYPFAYLHQMILEEIPEQLNSDQDNDTEDHEYHYHYRKIAWQAFEKLILPDLMENEKKNKEYDEDEEENEPDFMEIFVQKKHKSTNVKDWEFAVDCLADIIFEDRDWFFTTDWPQYLDGGMEPVRAASLGITENYFTNRLPKVTDKEAMQLLHEIMEWEL